ncbi:hypothetical protein [Patulibacter minatonensis]|uniref:hypothetical protein n=1 Tax=Patulibacter minatonensis TaxID=298163 RepID=UPI0004793071|nr:hypothetical protein [Patulibacter minatonensis]
MRVPALPIAVVTTAAVGAFAAAAVAQTTEPPPFEPEPTTTTTPTTTEPAPPADSSAPVVAVALPKTRTGSKIKSLRVTFKDPDTKVEFTQVDVKRRIRLKQGVRDQAYSGTKWFTTMSTSKYSINPPVGKHSISYTLKFKKGLPAARYWIKLQAQNEPGKQRTKTISFRTR